jgi:hypothetical protein
MNCEWKWSIGEAYYKSARKPKQLTPTIEEYDTQQSAIQQSLNDDQFTSSSNRRETLDNKMSDREMIGQRGANPFLQQSSYVNDVVVRDMFLKPINTTQGRSKEGEEE